jgi:hypothetical protein
MVGGFFNIYLSHVNFPCYPDPYLQNVPYHPFKNGGIQKLPYKMEGTKAPPFLRVD